MTTHDLILRDGQEFLTPKQKQLIILNPDVLEWDVNQLPKDEEIVLTPIKPGFVFTDRDINEMQYNAFEKRQKKLKGIELQTTGELQGLNPYSKSMGNADITSEDL